MQHASIHFFNLIMNSSSNPDMHSINSNSINPLNSRPQHLSNIHCLNSLIQLIDSRRINFLNCMRNSLMKLIHSSIASTVFRIYRQVPPYFDACFENDTYSHDQYVDGTQLVTGSKQRLLMQQQCCLLSRIFAVMYYLDRHHIG